MKTLFSYMLLAAVLLLSSCTSGKDSAGKTSANSKPAEVTGEHLGEGNMFERYTEKARRVIFFARLVGHDKINVFRIIAAFAQRIIGALCSLAVVEHPDDRCSFCHRIIHNLLFFKCCHSRKK